MNASPTLPTPPLAWANLREDAAPGSRRCAIVLDVSVVVFRCIWASILCVRCVSVVYLAGISSVYIFLLDPGMTYYTSLLGPKVVPQLLPMACCSAALAIAHSFKAVKMVVHSWQHRELVYEKATRDRRVRPQDVMVVGPPQTQNQSKTVSGRSSRFRSCCLSLAAVGTRLWRILFGREGFFSVRSEFFDTRLLAREIAEILSQTLQLITASQLIVKPWLTDLCAAVVVVNCWSTPVVQWLCRQKLNRVERTRRLSLAGPVHDLQSPSHDAPHAGFDIETSSLVALERIWCLSIDLVLDLVSSVAVPAIILVPYLRQFDFSTFDFPMALLYDDVKFVNLVYEHQHILAVNAVETVSTLFPHWSIFVCCDSLRVLIRRRESDHQHSSRLVRRDEHKTKPLAPTGAPTLHSIATFSFAASVHGTTAADVPAINATSRRGKTTFARHPALLKISHVAFVVWGVVALGFHLSALRVADVNARERPVGCKQALRPWLTRTSACSVFEYNCFMRNESSPNRDELRTLQRDSLAVLIFSHCNALVVPRDVQDFPNLLGFEIYNSTIAQWDRSAAFSVANQRRLTYVLILRTEMVSLPAGLLTELPPKLLDIEISGGNLSSLPEELATLWHPLTILYVENCALSSVPSVLTQLPVQYLSLTGNNITSLAPLSHRAPHQREATFLSLSLSQNPVQELPAFPIGDVTAMQFLSLEGTAIAALPEWIYTATRSGLKVYLKASQFCLNLSAEEVAEDFGADAPLSCVDDGDHGSVPMDLIDERRPIAPTL